MTGTSLFTSALAALTVGFVLQPVARRLMIAAKVIDLPSERSSHRIATPRGGGVAVAAAAAAGLLLHRPAWVVVVPLMLFAAIGLAEDLWGVPIVSRLVLQCGAGVCTGLILIPGGSGPTMTTLLVLTVALALMTSANAFNFMDGIDGISAVHAVLAGTVYVVIGLWHGFAVLAVAGTAVAAAALTFLPWNARGARIFLGDVGSYGLGGLLGAVATYGILHGVPLEAAIAPFALYLADTGWTLARRYCRGEEWYRPHRTHAYQRLTDVGWSHQRVTAVTALVSAAVCGCLLTAAHSGWPTRMALDAVSVALLAAYLASPSMLRIRRSHRPRPEQRRAYA